MRIRTARNPVEDFGKLSTEIFSGTTPLSKGDAYCGPDDGVPFIRSGQIAEDGDISLAHDVWLRPDIHNGLMKRSQLRRNDVLIAIVGATIGAAGVYESDDPANINQAIAAVRFPTNRILPRFAVAYLHTPAGQGTLDYLKRPVARANINLEEIGEIIIPVPPLPKQRELLAVLDDARVARREKLAQADALLGSLNDFVLDALGLTLPPTDSRTSYAVRLCDASQRFDPDYNNPRFRTLRDKIEHGKYSAQSVGSLFYPIVSGFAAGRDDQTDDPALGVPHIRPLNITSNAELHFDGTKMVPRSAVSPDDFLKQGEVLFNNTNSTAWVGKSVVFDADRDCACSNHITRLTLIDKRHNPYYFAAFFNALRSLGFFGLLSTNFNNQAGINVETLKAVRVPVPAPKDQEKIADEVGRRREEARRLRDEARIIWDNAKRLFEEELLGPEPRAGEPKPGGTKGGLKQ